VNGRRSDWRLQLKEPDDQESGADIAEGSDRGVVPVMVEAVEGAKFHEARAERQSLARRWRRPRRIVPRRLLITRPSSGWQRPRVLMSVGPAAVLPGDQGRHFLKLDEAVGLSGNSSATMGGCERWSTIR
jgi:hypothetical protein